MGYFKTLTKNILIVENNELNLKFFNDILQVNSYETVLALNLGETIDLAREHHPDLIVMNIQIPITSSLKIIKLIKADDRLKEIPIIAVTALATKNDEEKIRNDGCDGFVSKPISIPQFLETINSFLR